MLFANNARILIIQTAFLGDVILATSVVNSIKAQYPEAQVDLLVKKGNQLWATARNERVLMLSAKSLISGHWALPKGVSPRPTTH